MTTAVVTLCGVRNYATLPSGVPNFPVPKGSSARSEILSLTSSSVAGALTAASDEPFVSIVANDACFVAIGESPTAVALSAGASPPENSGAVWYIPSGGRLDATIEAGDSVAVIAA